MASVGGPGLNLPVGLRAYLLKAFQKSLAVDAFEMAEKLAAALERMVRDDLMEEEQGVLDADCTEKQRQKRFSEACRRRGDTIAKRLERKADLSSQISATCSSDGLGWPGAPDEETALVSILRQAEEATKRTVECGIVITRRHKRLRQLVRDKEGEQGEEQGEQGGAQGDDAGGGREDAAFKQVWDGSKRDRVELQAYATSMAELATSHWEQEVHPRPLSQPCFAPVSTPPYLPDMVIINMTSVWAGSTRLSHRMVPRLYPASIPHPPRPEQLQNHAVAALGCRLLLRSFSRGERAGGLCV